MKLTISILQQMCGTYEFASADDRLLKRKIRTNCRICGSPSEVTVDAIYRQYKRGNRIYKCQSCSNKMGWTDARKLQLAEQVTDRWTDPIYAGKITGKALARGIIKTVESE